MITIVRHTLILGVHLLKQKQGSLRISNYEQEQADDEERDMINDYHTFSI